MSGWKPGDVAMLRVDADTEIRVRRSIHGDWVGEKGAVYDNSLTARRLVVIDPEDREQVRRLTQLMFEVGHPFEGRIDATAEALREFANPTPSKPETSDAHDGCHDKGWTEVDAVRYCNNCGFSEGSRFLKPERVS